MKTLRRARGVRLATAALFAGATLFIKSSTSRGTANSSVPLFAIEVSIPKCSNVDKYAVIQMALKNKGPSTVTLRLKYTYYTKGGEIIEGSHWEFSGVRSGKTVVEEVLAVADTQCSQIGRVDVSWAQCSAQDDVNEQTDCLDQLNVGPGALVMVK